MQQQTVKEKIAKVVMSQPEDATYDEIMRELAFSRMVDRGLEDVRSGRVISNSEMANRIRSYCGGRHGRCQDRALKNT